MCSKPMVLIRNTMEHQHSTPLLPLSVRVRLEDELTHAWREFTEVYKGPFVGEDVHEKFWKWVTR